MTNKLVLIPIITIVWYFMLRNQSLEVLNLYFKCAFITILFYDLFGLIIKIKQAGKDVKDRYELIEKFYEENKEKMKNDVFLFMNFAPYKYDKKTLIIDMSAFTWLRIKKNIDYVVYKRDGLIYIAAFGLNIPFEAIINNFDLKPEELLGSTRLDKRNGKILDRRTM